MSVHLYEELKPKSHYMDPKLDMTREKYEELLSLSSTVYVGNLSIFSKEEKIYSLFSMAGNVEDVIMGISKAGNPIGFCFVVFSSHDEARYAVEYVSGMRFDGRVIRVDWDRGYEEGREYGRGSGGIQRRDCRQRNNDPDRPRPPIPDRSERNYKRNYHSNRDNEESEDSEGEFRRKRRKY